MFYAYLVSGFAIFGIGLLLAPGWWKFAWLALFLLGMMFLPWLLSKTLDPLNAKRIRSRCSSLGITNVKIQPFPNHYGVRFTKSNKKYYAKCKVIRGRIKWIGKSPEDIE